MDESGNALEGTSNLPDSSSNLAQPVAFNPHQLGFDPNIYPSGVLPSELEVAQGDVKIEEDEENGEYGEDGEYMEYEVSDPEDLTRFFIPGVKREKTRDALALWTACEACKNKEIGVQEAALIYGVHKKDLWNMLGDTDTVDDEYKVFVLNVFPYEAEIEIAQCLKDLLDSRVYMSSIEVRRLGYELVREKYRVPCMPKNKNCILGRRWYRDLMDKYPELDKTDRQDRNNMTHPGKFYDSLENYVKSFGIDSTTIFYMDGLDLKMEACAVQENASGLQKKVVFVEFKALVCSNPEGMFVPPIFIKKPTSVLTTKCDVYDIDIDENDGEGEEVREEQEEDQEDQEDQEEEQEQEEQQEEQEQEKQQEEQQEEQEQEKQQEEQQEEQEQEEQQEEQEQEQEKQQEEQEQEEQQEEQEQEKQQVEQEEQQEEQEQEQEQEEQQEEQEEENINDGSRNDSEVRTEDTTSDDIAINNTETDDRLPPNVVEEKSKERRSKRGRENTDLECLASKVSDETDTPQSETDSRSCAKRPRQTSTGSTTRAKRARLDPEEGSKRCTKNVTQNFKTASKTCAKRTRQNSKKVSITCIERTSQKSKTSPKTCAERTQQKTKTGSKTSTKRAKQSSSTGSKARGRRTKKDSKTDSETKTGSKTRGRRAKKDSETGSERCAKKARQDSETGSITPAKRTRQKSKTGSKISIKRAEQNSRTGSKTRGTRAKKDSTTDPETRGRGAKRGSETRSERYAKRTRNNSKTGSETRAKRSEKDTEIDPEICPTIVKQEPETDSDTRGRRAKKGSERCAKRPGDTEICPIIVKQEPETGSERRAERPEENSETASERCAERPEENSETASERCAERPEENSETASERCAEGPEENSETGSERCAIRVKQEPEVDPEIIAETIKQEPDTDNDTVIKLEPDENAHLARKPGERPFLTRFKVRVETGYQEPCLNLTERLEQDWKGEGDPVSPEFFYSWFEKFLTHVRDNINRKIVLLIREPNYIKYFRTVELARKYGVVFLVAPPPAFHKIYPMEGVSATLIQNMTIKAKKWMTKNFDFNTEDFPLVEVFKKGYNMAVKLPMARNGFFYSGFWPVNRNILKPCRMSADRDYRVFQPVHPIDADANLDPEVESELANITSVSDIEKLCRVCMKESAYMKPIFHPLNVTRLNFRPRQLVEELLDARISPYDGLPTNICNFCLIKLNDVMSTRKHAISSHEKQVKLLEAYKRVQNGGNEREDEELAKMVQEAKDYKGLHSVLFRRLMDKVLSNDFNMNSICRFCLSKEPEGLMKPIFSREAQAGNKDEEIRQKIMFVSKSQLENGDGLSSAICVTCQSRFNYAYKLIHKIMNAHKRLHDIVARLRVGTGRRY